jgi:cyclophilin family peptidyl-prolyl cis-trans isomerase
MVVVMKRRALVTSGAAIMESGKPYHQPLHEAYDCESNPCAPLHGRNKAVSEDDDSAEYEYGESSSSCSSAKTNESLSPISTVRPSSLPSLPSDAHQLLPVFGNGASSSSSSNKKLTTALHHQYPPSASTALIHHNELPIGSGSAHETNIISSSSDHHRHYHHHNSQALVFNSKQKKHPLYIIVVGFSLIGLFIYTKSHATVQSALNQVTLITQQRQRIHVQLNSAETDVRRLQRELITLDQMTQQSQPTRQHNNQASSAVSNSANVASGEMDVAQVKSFQEITALQGKLQEGTSQIGSLQQHVQHISKRDAIAKYGDGVYRVELDLDFPEDSRTGAGASGGVKGGPNTLILELAPLDIMPHSVYTFLEMVDAGLFDGCSFILNAMHVIKAAPLPYDGSSAAAKVRSFTEHNLESVAFREYSADYPHEQYTVGFAADGSPSFYINTQDNTDIHVGDPCFAKIVKGIDTVQRLEQAPTRNGIWYRQRIGIRKAWLLK